MILDNDEEDFCVVVTSRIGISKAKREPLRFYMFGNQFISPPNNKVITFFKGSPTEVKKAFYDGTIKINLKNRTLSKQLLLSFFYKDKED